MKVEEGDVKHLVAYGIGVWVSSKRSSKLQLYHAETLVQLQILNVGTAVQRMKEGILFKTFFFFKYLSEYSVSTFFVCLFLSLKSS